MRPLACCHASRATASSCVRSSESQVKPSPSAHQSTPRRRATSSSPDVPLARLQELHDGDRPVARDSPHDDPERSRGLALAVAGVDEQQRTDGARTARQLVLDRGDVRLGHDAADPMTVVAYIAQRDRRSCSSSDPANSARGCRGHRRARAARGLQRRQLLEGNRAARSAQGGSHRDAGSAASPTRWRRSSPRPCSRRAANGPRRRTAPRSDASSSAAA